MRQGFRGISLRQVVEDDMPFLFRLFTDPDRVEAAGRPAGLVFDYDWVLEDGHTKVTALLEEGSTGHGAGVIATALLVGRLFDSLPFRKVYTEVFGYNAAVARMLRKLDFAEEGVLKADRSGTAPTGTSTSSRSPARSGRGSGPGCYGSRRPWRSRRSSDPPRTGGRRWRGTPSSGGRTAPRAKESSSCPVSPNHLSGGFPCFVNHAQATRPSRFARTVRPTASRS